jgi:hypothetical protein
MNKLKTLKDMDITDEHIDKIDPEAEFGETKDGMLVVEQVMIKQLKQEAIKDIKRFMKDWRIKELPEIRATKSFVIGKIPFTFTLKKYEEKKRSGYSIIAYIMWKFNIKERDLK